MNAFEKVAFFGYVAVLFLYNIPFFVISHQWLILAITTWAIFIWAWTVLRTQCTRCYHIHCPLNRVPEDVRKVFFENYPEFTSGLKDKMK